MTRTVPVIVLAVLLTLSACSKETKQPSGSESAEPQVTASAASSLPAEGTSPAEAEPTSEPRPGQAAAAQGIPSAYLGRWGLVPKDCTSTLGDAKGLLTVSGDQLKFYESVATLRRVKDTAGDRFRGTFDFSGEGQSWTLDVALDLQDGGKTLIRKDTGPDAMPGSLTYKRCA